MKVVGNAFSVNMLDESRILVFKRITTKEVISEICMEKELVSIVGHEGTANLISQVLGREIQVNRVQYKLKAGDILYVCVVKQRLEEGRVLKEEELKKVEIDWWKIQIITGGKNG